MKSNEHTVAPRLFFLYRAEIKFMTRTSDIANPLEMPAKDRQYVSVVIEDHPQERELSNAIVEMLDALPSGGYAIWSSPIRAAKPSPGMVDPDMRRVLRVALNPRGRTPARMPDGSIVDAFSSIWPGNKIDIRIQLYATTVRVPFKTGHGDENRLVFANATGLVVADNQRVNGLEGL